jgi:hypothetical protein
MRAQSAPEKARWIFFRLLLCRPARHPSPCPIFNDR